jgi:hypothetical protein
VDNAQPREHEPIVGGDSVCVPTSNCGVFQCHNIGALSRSIFEQNADRDLVRAEVCAGEYERQLFVFEHASRFTFR